jgi:hypothetical protein
VSGRRCARLSPLRLAPYLGVRAAWARPGTISIPHPIRSMRTFRSLVLAAGAALTLVAAAGTVDAQPFPTLAPGQSVQGRLESGDPALTDHGRFKVYQVRAEAGRRYVVRMDSDDFDAYLTLARPVGGVTDYIRHDDDGGDGTNARLRFSVPASGTYLILAQSLGSEGTGAFTLALDTVHVRPAPVRDLTLGETVRGTLTEGDAEYEDDEEGVYHLYRFRGVEGQRVRVRMDSDEIETTVEVGMMDGSAFIALEQEFGGYGNVAMATLPSAGTYYVRAGGYGEGDYTLRVEERVSRPIQARPIQRGQSVTGTLGAGDADLDDGRLVDAYSFTGRAGEQVSVTLRSDDFDTFLFLGRMEGGVFQQLETNDDDGDSLNSRIDYTLPASGEYVIHATSFGAGAEGTYVVRVEP